MIFDHIKITCSKSDLRSDQDHDLEFSQKVIGDKIVILDHFLGRSLWIFFPQFSELRFGFNIVVWVLFLNNSSFLCIFQVKIFDLRLLIKDSNFYWLCQVLSLESDTRLCIKKLELFRKIVSTFNQRNSSLISCNFNTMMAAKFKCCCLRARVVFNEWVFSWEEKS